MRIAVALAAVIALSGCDGGASDDTPEARGDASGGEYRQTFDLGDGNDAEVRAGGNIDVQLPAGFTVYPGAEVVTTMSASSADGEGRTTMMTTNDDPADVIAFYRKQAEAAGFAIANEMDSGTARMISGQSADGTGLNVIVGTGEDGTTISLSIGKAGSSGN
ncbi:hypothetical protein [Qipengyuania sp. JC766]|uniref:hypothetical protein n=1 Tax=Qipengyuania sp. JC766 TaxID=3232139 RepID=UPI00345963FC